MIGFVWCGLVKLEGFLHLSLVYVTYPVTPVSPLFHWQVTFAGLIFHIAPFLLKQGLPLTF